MATYKLKHKRTNSTTLKKLFYVEELYIYGSQRHGVMKPDIYYTEASFNLSKAQYVTDSLFPAQSVSVYNRLSITQTGITNYVDGTFEFWRGYKQYELANHLGNVLVTIQDRKWGVQLSTPANANLSDYYMPYVVTISDYTAFGSIVTERSQSFGSGYKYGFNNQEKDAELGDYYSFEYRVHDARIGRFLSVDPLSAEYPWNSTYAFAENDVIRCKDLEGAERYDVNVQPFKNGSTAMLRVTFNLSYQRVYLGNPKVFTNYRNFKGANIVTNKDETGILNVYRYRIATSAKNGGHPIREEVVNSVNHYSNSSMVGARASNVGQSGWQPLTSFYFDMKFEPILFTQTRTNIVSRVPVMSRVMVGRTPIRTINIPVVTMAGLTPLDRTNIATFCANNPGLTNINVVRSTRNLPTPEAIAAFSAIDAAQQAEYAMYGKVYNAVTLFNQPVGSKVTTTGGDPIFGLRQTGWTITTQTEQRTMQMNADETTTPIGDISVISKAEKIVDMSDKTITGTTPWKN